MSNIRDYLEKSREQEASSKIEHIEESLSKEGFRVKFGTIGLRTTYALIFNEDSSREILGYTFIKDISYYNAEIGKLKALQQAVARKNISDRESANHES